MLKKTSLFIAASLALSTAYAENQIGLYFTPSADIDNRSSGEGSEVRGDGFGVIGKFDILGTAFITGEYSVVTYDEQTASDIDLNQARVGIGAMLPLFNSSLSAMVHAEVINFDFDSGGDDSSETGGGVHAGLVFEPNPVFNVYAQGGFISVDDFEGPEFKVGVNVNAGERITVFTDYRVTRIDDDTDSPDSDFEDLHVGAALKF